MTKKVTKAEKVRIMLRRDLGKKTEDQLITAVMKLCSFERGLAKSYVRHYTPIIKAEKKEMVAKNKKGTSKRAAKE